MNAFSSENSFIFVQDYDPQRYFIFSTQWFCSDCSLMNIYAFSSTKSPSKVSFLSPIVPIIVFLVLIPLLSSLVISLGSTLAVFIEFEVFSLHLS